MGEYARLHILEEHGIDIGDDEPVHKQRTKKYSCSCGRWFTLESARQEHQRATGHGQSRRQKAEGGKNER